MTAESFFTNFGHLADAANGVQKLRELILHLAVQGKLVPQDPNDEPASVLLERVLAQKQQLIKKKKLRKTKAPMAYDGEEEVELPSSWVYTTLYDIGEIAPRNEACDETEASFIPMPLISEFYGVPVQSETRTWGKIKSGFTHFAEGDVCLAKITPCFQNGKSAVMRGLRNGIGAGTTELHVFRAIDETVCPEYVLIFLKSPLFINEGIPRMTGSAGQKRITRDYFAGKPFPLPPLEEQKRIVAKVDQLMALCNELEARQQKQQQGRVRLNNAALDALLNARGPDEFADHWQRISTNFDLLYDHPETIAKLRAALLQLAVQGKLVPQDPNDEPASVLLERIKAERRKGGFPASIKSGDLDLISDALKSSCFPHHWHIAELADIALAIVDCPHSTPKWTDEGKLCVRTNQFKPGRLDLNNSRYVSAETYTERIERLKPQANDVLYSREGGILGVACRVPENIDLCLGQRMMLFRSSSCCFPEFLELVLNSPLITEIARKQTTGGAAPRVNVATVKAYPIPVPPLQEQKRIVAKVDQLMTLCDELEAKLNQAQQNSEKLMEATVRKLMVT